MIDPNDSGPYDRAYLTELDATKRENDELRAEVSRLGGELKEACKPLKFPRDSRFTDIIEGMYINRIREAMPEDAPAWALDPYFIRLALLAVEKVSAAPAHEESER